MLITRMSTKQPTTGRIAAGLIINIFLPGVGTMVVGKVGDGLTQLILSILLFWTIVVPLVVWIWAVVDVAIMFSESNLEGDPSAGGGNAGGVTVINQYGGNDSQPQNGTGSNQDSSNNAQNQSSQHKESAKTQETSQEKKSVKQQKSQTAKGTRMNSSGHNKAEKSQK